MAALTHIRIPQLEEPTGSKHMKGVCFWLSYTDTGHKSNIAQPKAHKYLSSTSHVSPFNCCLSVVL